MTDKHGTPANDWGADAATHEEEEPAGTYDAPQTELERSISEVWQDVIQVERISVSDNFFDVGGHSLAMVKAYEKLQDTFRAQCPGREVALVEMFEHPTVRSLAKHLSGPAADESGIKRMQELARKQKVSLQRQKNAAAGRKSNHE